MSTSPVSETDTVAQERDALIDRMLRGASEAFNLFAIHVGDQLGFYRELVGGQAMTSTQLSEATGTNERYVREWLEHQTVAGVLEVEDAGASARERRYRLPEGRAEVLAGHDSLNYLAPLAQLVAGAVAPIDHVVEAFRQGGGVAYGDYGRHLREGQARMNRAAFLYQLGPEWLGSIADVRERLEADPAARVADFGCGAGWSSIGIARSYPKAEVHGLDMDEPSIELARRNAEEHGVTDRVRFEVRDAGDPELAGRYDLVVAMECLHDMSDPVSALRSMRRMTHDEGSVLIVDERTGDQFTPSGNDVEGLLYGFSVLHCLPAGMAEQPSAGTGTVMRADTMRSYASDAGFREVEVLPIENYFFQFYRLHR